VGLLEELQQERARRTSPALAWPVGKAAVPFDGELGHDDSRFSPEMYGDYLVTSNEVFSAVMLRARLMAGLELVLYKGRPEEKARVDAGPARELLDHINPFWTWRRLARMDELCMGLWGETVWAVERDGAGIPREVWWLKPSQVAPVVHPTKYLEGWIYQPTVAEAPIVFRADEVVWFRYPNPLDEFSALAPLAAARLAADTGRSMMASNAKLFEQGLQLGGLIVPDTDKVMFSPDQARELEGDLERRFKGVDRAHKWAVLRYEAQFRALGVSPKDAEFIDGLGVTLRQVCNAYGIPAPLLNDMEHATLSNAREYERLLWAHALVPDSEERAAEVAEQLLPMFGRGRLASAAGADHAAFDYTRVPALQEAASAVWDRERQAMDSGALTINEWRKRQGLPEVAWGDVWWAPVNKQAVDSPDTPRPEPAPASSSSSPAPRPDQARANGNGHLDPDQARALVDAIRLP
jgi:HK97 family phage portal protein